jgi:hypothetical protein
MVKKTVRVGDTALARLVETQWPRLQTSLFYICVFSPQAIGGRVAAAANRAMQEYIQDKLETANRMLKAAQAEADEADVEIGAAGYMHETVVNVSSRPESLVLKMIRAYDDYVVVMDSMWIGGELTDERRDDAHATARNDVRAVRNLAVKMSSRLVTYRRNKSDETQTKSDADVVLEIENMVLLMAGEGVPETKAKAVPAVPTVPNAEDAPTKTTRPPQTQAAELAAA